MAGYIGYSKSRNAAQAEKEGKFPASVCAKRTGVPTALIRQYLRPCEWHHTSKWFNETDYFNLRAVAIVFGRTPPDDDDQYQPNPAAIQALGEYRQRLRKAEARVYENCKVEWLEWSGSRTRPTSKRRVAYDCRVSVKGVTATITFTDGTTMVKRLATNGFGYSQDKNRDAERTEIEQQLQRDQARAQKAAARRQKALVGYHEETARRDEIIRKMLPELALLFGTGKKQAIVDAELQKIMQKALPCLMTVGGKEARRKARRQIRAAVAQYRTSTAQRVDAR